MKKRNLHTDLVKRLLFAACALFFAVLQLHANPKSRPARHLVLDSSSVALHQPSAKKQSEYQDDAYWKYGLEEHSGKMEPGVFDRLLQQLMNKLFSSTQSSGVPSTNWWNLSFIALLAALIIIFVLRATNSGANTLFRGKNAEDENIDASAEDVDIHAINYEEQIARALGAKDFRLAVRLWFLRSLKELSDKELLHWKIDKTNSDYYYELSGSNFQQGFGKISFFYDYAWYGEFSLDEVSYRKAEEEFRDFYNRIHA